jgi:hypothetical protein
MNITINNIEESSQTVTSLYGQSEVSGFMVEITFNFKGNGMIYVGNYEGCPAMGEKAFIFFRYASSEKEVLFELQGMFDFEGCDHVEQVVKYKSTSMFGRGETEFFADYDEALDFATGGKSCVHEVIEYT